MGSYGVSKRLAAAGLALFLAAAPGAAWAEASPEALQAAAELFEVISPDLMGQLVQQTNNALWPMLEEQLRTEAKVDDATIAELRGEFERLQLTHLNEMMKEAPPIYAERFSVDEIRQLIAFYKTPVGQKAITEMPRVMGDFIGKMQPHMVLLQRETEAAFTRILTARGYKQP